MALFDDASLVTTPNGYKAGTLYSIKPTSGAGDMTVVRATTATRVNSAGLIESVANNVPRLDYTDSTCPSLLVEPQRTNLVLYSSSFDNAAWFKLNATITANNTTSPSGIQDADAIVDDATNGGHVVYQFTGTQLIGTSWSCYMKKGTLDYGYISAVQSSTLFTTCVINLTNGAIHELQNGSSTTGTVTIEDCGNGWYRVKMQTNANAAGYAVGTSNGSALSGTYKQAIYAGTGSGNIYIWGAQLEDASYPTSYIPTTSAAVTRNADAIYKTGISSLIGQTEGTVYFEIDKESLQDGSRYMFVSDASFSNRIVIYQSSSGINVYCSAGATFNFVFNPPSGNLKVAVGYKSGLYTFFVNGIERATSNISAVPTGLNTTGLGVNEGTLGADAPSVSYKAAALFPTRLTNAELASLTTL